MHQLNQHIEFYQEQFRKPVVKLPLHHIIFIWVGVLVFWLLLSVLDYYSTLGAESKLIQLQETTQPLEKVAAKLQAELDSLGRGNKSFAKTEEELRSSLSSKRRFLASLEQQGNDHSVYFSQYLNALANVRSDALWLTRIQINTPGPSLNLSGMAKNAKAIPIYMGLFKEQPEFGGLGFRVFNVSKPSGDNHYLRFSVSTKHE